MSGHRSGQAVLLIESQNGFDSIDVRASNTIGRDRRCDIVLDHPTASRLHARLWQDEHGWHYQDMGSQNGSKLGEAKVLSPIPLGEGTSLRIGRVRAYFFASGVPETWTPPHEADRHGKLIRCRCGHIGWAPQYTLGMTLKCTACGRDLIHSNQSIDLAPRPAVDCAACHSPIQPSESLHVCPECGAQMHETCWRELGGCAMYGCGRVRPHAGEDASNRPTTDDASPSEEMFASTYTRDSDSTRYRLAQCGLAVLTGLPTFGVPAIALAAYRLVASDSVRGKQRLLYATISLLGGAVGFIASSYWWLGGPRPWRLL